MRKDKETAIELRKKGYSYNQISSTLGIPKSTLGGWLRCLGGAADIKAANVSKAQKIWAANIISYNKKRSLEARNRWSVWQSESASEIGCLSMRELFLLGIGLYWAEGDKRANWNLVFCNSVLRLQQLGLPSKRSACRIIGRINPSQYANTTSR